MIEILDNIPIVFNVEHIIASLHIRKHNNHVTRIVQELVDQVTAIARPKAIYSVSRITNRKGYSIEIDGVPFTSHVLSKNLATINRVFVYVATCGIEIDAIKISPTNDLLRDYCLDTIKRFTLITAIRHLIEHWEQRYQPGKMSHMNPGSLADWPVSQQRSLFRVLGDVEESIGVSLTDGMAMVPTKSVSGIYFTTETGFESCQLCPIEKCPGRRAIYDPQSAREYRVT